MFLTELVQLSYLKRQGNIPISQDFMVTSFNLPLGHDWTCTTYKYPFYHFPRIPLTWWACGWTMGHLLPPLLCLSTHPIFDAGNLSLYKHFSILWLMELRPEIHWSICLNMCNIPFGIFSLKITLEKITPWN